MLRMFTSFCRVWRVRLPYRRSRVKWICATAAPWALATGLLISFTASASNDLHSGVSFSPRSATARLIDTALVPPTGASIADGRLGIERDVLRSLPRYDLPDEAADSAPLKADRKADAGPEAIVDRSAKGNPLVAPQATLSRRAKQLRPVLNQIGSARLLYSRDERLLPPTVLMEGQLEATEIGAGFRALAGARIQHDPASHLGPVAGGRGRRFDRSGCEPDDPHGQARDCPVLHDAGAHGRHAHGDRRGPRLPAIAAPRPPRRYDDRP